MKTRREYEEELMREPIPGCTGADEDTAIHVVHMTEWLIKSLIDARMKLDAVRAVDS